MVEDFGLMVGVVIVGAYLPEGWASPLFTRRPRRSRPQGTLQRSRMVLLGRLASSPPAECNSAFPVLPSANQRALPHALCSVARWLHT